MRNVVLGFILVFVGMPAGAADPPSETHRKAATELLEAMNLERTMMGGVTAMADAMIQQNPTLGPYRDVLLSWAEKFMTWETFAPKMTDLYTESFAEAELRDLTAFYKTRTGQKALALMPELMRRGAMIGAEVASAHTEELDQMIRARAAELEKQTTKP